MVSVEEIPDREIDNSKIVPDGSQVTQIETKIMICPGFIFQEFFIVRIVIGSAAGKSICESKHGI